MRKNYSRIIWLGTAFLLAISTTTAALAERSGDTSEHLVWTESTGSDGLSRNLPTVETQLFTRRIQDLQTRLIRHASELEIEAEEKELGVSDAIIAAIMPGGLIYAGIRQHDCNQTKAALREVKALMKTLAQDILAYQYATGSVVVAQLN